MRVRRVVKRIAIGVAVVVVASCGGTLASGWRAFGARPTGARLARIEKSPQWRDGSFVNPQPMVNDSGRAMSAMFGASPDATPRTPPSVVATDPATFASAPASGVRVTWFGHSSTLIELDGARVLTDANWGERASPLSWAGPARYYPPPLALDALPHLDAVIISHDHYDHLDMSTITALASRVERFVVPLGIGAHLELWGVPPDHITELDWWEHTNVAELDVVCTPSRHASGRFVAQNKTLWSSWSLIGPAHRVFYSGDTGLFPALTSIGEKLGPFDLALVEVGQYHQAWPDWHLGPEQAVRLTQMVRARVLFPVHWGLFTLAPHAWTEPAERVVVAAEKAHVALSMARPGASVEPLVAPSVERWWPALPWLTAEENPIVSRGF